MKDFNTIFNECPEKGIFANLSIGNFSNMAHQFIIKNLTMIRRIRIYNNPDHGFST
jgi:hypothetical protein